MKKNVFVLLFMIVFSPICAQYRYPLDVSPILSGSFAELRPNHFHSGIDLKTENVINKPVYAIESGYVSRISVSPSGYGLLLCINHPDGNTSLYAHLNSFTSKIQEYVRAKQYELETYSIDLVLEQNQIPVQKGEWIASSGNTGSSFGPHVHFEIRKNNSEEAVDPLAFYKNRIDDTMKPIIRNIAIYPIENSGVADNNATPIRQSITVSKKGEYLPLKDTVEVWGKIGIGLNAVDKMNGTNNVYGVKKVRLLCDNNEIFLSNISSFRFDQTRMINSFTDFDYWNQKKVFYMKSFVEPGNKLPIYKTINNGYLTIDQERLYDLCYELEDLHGNATRYDFVVKGKRQTIPQQRYGSQMMVWDQNNHYITDSFSLIVPKGNLYTDVALIINTTSVAKYFSPQYTLHNKFVPLDKPCNMKIKLTRDSLINKSQYGIVKINGGKEMWVGGNYTEGYMTTRIREFGNSYAVSCDTQAPTITPVQPASWIKQSKITIKLSDNKSGIESYKGTIDGVFVLFEYDAKSTSRTYMFDSSRLKKTGKKRKFEFTATDACGNLSTYNYEFVY